VIISRARQRRLEHQVKLGRPVTAKEVAEALGITEATLSRIERSTTERIDFATLNKLCEFYQLGVGAILEWVPDQAQENAEAQG
jgi:DNA-binding Xre family transcriptional regulator